MTEDEKLWVYGIGAALAVCGVIGWWRKRHPKAPAAGGGDTGIRVIAAGQVILGIVVAITAKTVFGEMEGIVLLCFGFLTAAVLGGLSGVEQLLRSIDARLERAERRLGGGEEAPGA